MDTSSLAWILFINWYVEMNRQLTVNQQETERYSSLLKQIQQQTPLNPAQQKQLIRCLEIEDFPKNSTLLAAGQMANHLYFVKAGVVRSFRIVDGQDVTRWFSLSNQFAVSYNSFFQRQPSNESLVTVSDVSLISISYASLQHLFHQDPIWMGLGLKFLGQYYISTLNSHLSLQTQSAAERYRSLLDKHPDIIHKVPLGQIASFLGMSQPTLSRLRSRGY